MILAKTNVCQVGNHLFSLAVLTAAAEVLSWIDSDQPSASNPELFKIDTGTIYHVTHSYSRPALNNRWLNDYHIGWHDLEVVTALSEGACADPRDHIYGVVSLFRRSDRYEIDYTLSEAEVFSDFTKHCLWEVPDVDLLCEFRPATEFAHAHHDPPSGLPSWCPGWSVAQRRSNMVLGDCGFGWRAGTLKDFLYTESSRLTLAVEGVIVSRVRLCNEASLKVVQSGNDGRCDLRWCEHRKDLCHYFELQGLKIDHSAKDAIVRIFKRMIPPRELWMRLLSTGSTRDSPYKLEEVLRQIQPDDLVALLAPVYLREVDPELFQAATFEVDARLSQEDYPYIRKEFARVLGDYGRGTWLFVTEDGMQGAGYPGIQQGDLVCIVYGSKEPQILHRVDGDDEGHYLLMGSCNVDGLMYGEGLEMGLTEQKFILV